MSPARRGPVRGKRAFAATWWGRAWVIALEDSTLDAGRLSRGRTYARSGAVGQVTVTAGAVKAPVQGSRPRPYRTAVRLPVLTDAQWDTLLDTIAARAGHAAALLDGEMPQDLADAADAAGTPLLPRPHEFDPGCSCPDWGYPCKHAAALCYAIAATIDADPFTLFTLRGRTRERVLAALQSRRAAAPARDEPPAADPAAGTPAAAAYARWAAADGRPPPDVADHWADHWTGHLAAITPYSLALPEDPPAGSGLTAAGLSDLVADTASRAARLLAGDAGILELTRHQDAVRLATALRTPEYFHALLTGTGLRPLALARLIHAWRHGGEAGLAAAEQPSTPGRTVMAGARTAVTEALAEMAGAKDTPDPPRTWRNRLTIEAAGIQLRLGPDARWHPYRYQDGTWWPCAPPSHDAVDALTAAWDPASPQGDRP